MTEADTSLLGRVATQLSRAPSYAEAGVKASILTVAAASYGSRSQDDEVTQPTGFDPEAAALFEAVVEGAFLVAHADDAARVVAHADDGAKMLRVGASHADDLVKVGRAAVVALLALGGAVFHFKKKEDDG